MRSSARARGAWARGLAFAALLFALANPLIVHETREPLPDVVVIVIDRSQSMSIGTAPADADAALARRSRSASPREKDLEVRETSVTTTDDRRE